MTFGDNILRDPWEADEEADRAYLAANPDLDPSLKCAPTDRRSPCSARSNVGAAATLHDGLLSPGPSCRDRRDLRGAA